MEGTKNFNPKFLTFSFIKNDLPAGLVVFLVALPLCLGIALASGAPLFSGLIAGIVGGLVVSSLSGSQLAVSGPAAGLTVIVLNSIETLGSFQAFLLAVVISGIFQLILGFLKAGTIGNYFPTSVIKGMLAAIGIILILKQIPHAFGYDADYEGDFTFIQVDKENSFSEIINAVNKSHIGAIIISIVSLVILILWETKAFKKVKAVPGPLVAVIVGIIINYLFGMFLPDMFLSGDHMVNIPVTKSLSDFQSLIVTPDFSQLTNPNVYVVAGTLAIVASLETLLCIEAIDKLDPMKRTSSTNKELKAQGVGNTISGLLGGLPMTAVIVRGAANVNSGAKTRTSAFFHGVFLLGAVLFIPTFINMIPLASLAAILLMVGYKLTKITLYKGMYKAGLDQFMPFIITILAIVFTDLLKGIAIGLAVGVFYLLRRNAKNYFFHKEDYVPGKPITITLADEVSFLNKASIQLTLDHLPLNSHVIIDGTRSAYIDYDVLEILNDFKENAKYKNIHVELKGIKEVYKVGAH